MARCTTHCPPASSAGIPGPLTVAALAAVGLFRAGRWGVPRLAVGLVAASVLAWRWHTGAIMRPTWRGRPRWARRVRAATRCALTAATVAALAAPAVTAYVLAALAAAGSVAALVARDRRRPRPAPAELAPRRVRVKVGPPRPPRRPAAALAAEPATDAPRWRTRAGAR